MRMVRQYRSLERAFLVMAGAYALFVSPNAISDALSVLRDHGVQAVPHLATALALLLVGLLFLYLGTKGRAPQFLRR